MTGQQDLASASTGPRANVHLDRGNAAGTGARPKRIALCGLPYSPNLGDGVISDCLAHLVPKLEPGAEIVRIDLAGREDFVAGQPGRMLFMQVAKRLPAAARQQLVRGLLGYKVGRKLRARWLEQLRGVDAAIIGGGQLLDDVDLNFPIKLATMASCLQELRIPYAIACVGVSRNWSRTGLGMFERTLTGPEAKLIAVRDAASMDSLLAQIPAARLPRHEIIPDPGILANEVYLQRSEGGTSPTVGINVADPVNLGYSGSVSEGLTAEAWLRVYEDLVTASTKAGLEPVLFTNGAFEDDVYCGTVAAHLAGKGMAARTTPRPTTPPEMAALIAGHRLVISPRLHACIVAESFGIPSIAMGPVRKLEAFYHTLEMKLRNLTAATLKGGAAGIGAVIDDALTADNRTAMDAGRTRVEHGIRDLLDAILVPAKA